MNKGRLEFLFINENLKVIDRCKCLRFSLNQNCISQLALIFARQRHLNVRNRICVDFHEWRRCWMSPECAMISLILTISNHNAILGQIDRANVGVNDTAKQARD
eukprot:NODE_156_length_16689_cov_0.273960.p14 type:complete len:104 gc:universal NODE_156_length_16689_cov_0.273960:9232-9543(+)